MRSNIINFFIIVSLLTPSINLVHAERMESGNYTIQSDSVNFAGERSISGSYKLEDTGGEVGTGDLQSSNKNLHSGFQQATVSVAPTPVPTPDDNQGGSSGTSGSIIGSPMNVSDFTATPLSKNILLNWKYPLDSDIGSVLIVRSDKFFPNSTTDGEIIFEGNTESVVDNDVVSDVTYYYAIFAKNLRGDYSSGALAQARVIKEGGLISTTTTKDIFENIPIITNVDERISNLSFLDFDFIQNGRKIEHAENIVPIDGTKNLTIELAYNKVPEILKTIAITLFDPDDKSKVFTFLIRVNKDKTAYEATIAPLGKSGNYRLSAIILDYKNQGLKRLDGSLKALVLEEGQNLFAKMRNNNNLLFGMIGFLVLAFIIILILVIIEKRKKAKNKIKS